MNDYRIYIYSSIRPQVFRPSAWIVMLSQDTQIIDLNKNSTHTSWEAKITALLRQANTKPTDQYRSRSCSVLVCQTSLLLLADDPRVSLPFVDLTLVYSIREEPPTSPHI